MASGTVKWFNSAKGYGFICPSEGGQDVFAHFSTILMDGYKSLKAGQPVSFQVNRGPKGLHATEIRALGEPPIEMRVINSSENTARCQEEIAEEETAIA